MSNVLFDALEKQKIYPIRDRSRLDLEYLPTGILSLDNALDGGFVRRGFTEIGGVKGYGKTLTALIAGGRLARHGRMMMYIYMETGSVDPRWAVKFGVDLTGDNCAYFELRDGEAVADTVVQGIKASSEIGLELIVIDSLPYVMPSADMYEKMTGSRVAANALMLTELFKRIPGYMNTDGRQVALVGINQVRDAGVGKGGPVYGSPYTFPGGRAKDHAATLQIQMDSPTLIKSGKDVVGKIHQGHVLKNKGGSDQAKFEFKVYGKPETVFYWGDDAYRTGTELGIFQNKAGEVYTGSGTVMFDGVELGTSQDAAKQAIQADLGLYNAIELRVHDILRERRKMNEPD